MVYWRITALFTLIVLGMATTQTTLDDVMFSCSVTDNVTSDCCLPCDVNTTCNNTCPEGQLLLNRTYQPPSCISSTNVSVINTTSPGKQSRDFVMLCVTSCPMTYYENSGTCAKCEECDRCSDPGIRGDTCTCPQGRSSKCQPECDFGFYSKNDGACTKCDDACTSCTTSGDNPATCVCKFKYNGTCFSSCPDGMTCSTQSEEAVLIILEAVIVGSIGGLLVIVIFITCVVCCRRSHNRHRFRLGKLPPMCGSPTWLNSKHKSDNPDRKTAHIEIHSPWDFNTTSAYI